MALLADIDDSYTKTGKNWFGRWSDKLTYIPFIGGWLAFPLGAVGTVVESAQYLFRGQFGSAITALLAGGASTATNAFVSVGNTWGGITNGAKWTWWAGNAASGGLTGATLGTHARAATETVIGAVSGALGAKPQVLRSYQAGIGSIGSSAVPQGPGRFFSEAARSRGENNPDAAYARYTSGQADHITALEAARAQGTSAYRGA